MAVRIDNILDNYDEDLEKAKGGKCKKIVWCNDFKESFQHDYKEIYKGILDDIREKLIERGHSTQIEEDSQDEIFYGFTFSLIPRHILSGPIDRFFPSSIKSTISFKANEHTMTIDVETNIRPVIDKWDSSRIEKISGKDFNRSRFQELLDTFVEQVFNETIVVDFKK